MSWIQKLFETYEACAGNESIPDSGDLFPVSHTTQQAHIEIVINKFGDFKRATVVEKKEDQKTLIPCTEESAGRAGIKPKNHPLCDKLQYVAGDFVSYGGEVTKGFLLNPTEPFENFCELLGAWCGSSFKQEKAVSVFTYVRKKHLIQDLVLEGVLPTEINSAGEKKVLLDWNGDKNSVPKIYKALPAGQNPMDAFVRFKVESNNSLESGTWESPALIRSWIDFYASNQEKKGLCFVSGHEQFLAEQHPAKIRHDADKAKLISSNDNSGYTFKGRFTESNQVVSVSFEATQKAHNALRWLVRRKQASRSGDQIFVAWAIKGKEIPDLCANSLEFLGHQELNTQTAASIIGDVGQSFAYRLNKKIAGYKANINYSENIVIIGLDSATPGRMAIIYYRELTGSEFLERIESWHSNYSWFQYFGKDLRFVGAPSPRDIAWAAYGTKSEGKNGLKLLNATMERLLPCIVDAAQFPLDLVLSSVRRVSNRINLELWEWEKCLGITCSLYKGVNKQRGYKMALEENRIARDYLFGRLLAVAEQLESIALYYAKENRDTTAARLMQRFADRPFSTWKLIENSLSPYKARINSKAPGLLVGYKELLDEIHGLFISDEYINDKQLSGEYLLGYHCQRKWIREHKRENGKWVLKDTAEVDAFAVIEE
jgi:CRISPR-associated protein Csd1